jgi:hypothetical protein
MAKSETPIGSDICQCGDYRSQHGFGEIGDSRCRICVNSRELWGGCDAFRFHRSAMDSELKHWQEYYGKVSHGKV